MQSWWIMMKRLKIIAITVLILMAVPQAVAQPPVPQALPEPLTAADVERYRAIFDLQHEADTRDSANWDKADALIAQLDDDLLLGRVLSQRYLHPTAWRSSYGELEKWLAQYSDHPHASRISWLAARRKPQNAASPQSPKKGYLNGYGRTAQGRYYIAIPASGGNRASPAKTRAIARDIRFKIRDGWPTGGKNMLNAGNLRYLTKYEEAVLRADIAHGYFIYGKDLDAIAQAEQALALAAKSQSVPQAYWTAGIAAWRSGDIARAMRFFAPLAEDSAAPPALVSSAAFWASRGALRANNPQDSFAFLALAAQHQDTFYGTLAAEALGQEITLNLTLPTITPDFITWLNTQPGGRRAFALLQVGETYHASRELRYLWGEMDDSQQLQTMALAAHTHMAGLAFRTADIIREATGRHFYAGLYPIPDFAVTTPLKVDHALLLAVMRQESGFNPRAKSSARASGLMQLLPATAAFIAKDRRLAHSTRHTLLYPAVNIRLGAEYILHLLDEPVVEGDLIRLLAAYNGGPGNLKKWAAQVNHNGDALMLLESLPSRETRFYVKNTLTNLWIYRKLLGAETHDLGVIAGGIDAVYTPAFEDCVITRLSQPCASVGGG